MDAPMLAREGSYEGESLSNVETVHALHVLHVALDKLGLVGATRVDPQLQAAALAQSVGEEITQMLAGQKKLEDQYVALVAEQPQLRNLPNKNKLYENQKAVHTTAEQLRLGTQALVRNLKASPGVSENMAKVAVQRQALQQLLHHCTAQLLASQTCPVLAEYVEGVEKHDLETQATIERERITSAAVKQLKAEIKDEKSKHEEQMRRAGQALAELNGQQKAVALGGSSKARYREAQVGAANECARRLESNSLSEVQDQIAVLQQQLEIDHQVQEAGSAYSEKVQAWLREETIEWGSRIDADVAAKEKDTEAVKQERQRDLIKLKDMKEKHEKETSLKAERDSTAKDAADREAADQVHSCHMHHLCHVLMWHYRPDTPETLKVPPSPSSRCCVRMPCSI
ncbi:TPA: hypothetical protein ACH3X3_001545 [Trebouxia sp. C0006]